MDSTDDDTLLATAHVLSESVDGRWLRIEFTDEVRALAAAVPVANLPVFVESLKRHIRRGEAPMPGVGEGLEPVYRAIGIEVGPSDDLDLTIVAQREGVLSPIRLKLLLREEDRALADALKGRERSPTPKVLRQ